MRIENVQFAADLNHVSMYGKHLHNGVVVVLSGHHSTAMWRNDFVVGGTGGHAAQVAAGGTPLKSAPAESPFPPRSIGVTNVGSSGTHAVGSGL